MKLLHSFVPVAWLFLFAWSSTASAFMLSFNPVDQTVGLGNKAYVDVVVDDVLPDGLGNYDFDVLFDDSILAFDQAVDGMGLGFSMGLGASLGAGKITLSDFSLEMVQDLLAQQANRFTLLTLVFDTLSVGGSELAFNQVNLANATGDTIEPEPFAPGSVTVNTQQIPEPESLALLAMGGLAIWVTGRLGRRRQGHSRI